MKSFKLDRKLAQLALLQRTELSTKLQKKIRKLFGRYLFSNFFSKYMTDVKKVSIDYYNVMYSEYSTIEKYINSKMRIRIITRSTPIIIATLRRIRILTIVLIRMPIRRQIPMFINICIFTRIRILILVLALTLTRDIAYEIPKPK